MTHLCKRGRGKVKFVQRQRGIDTFAWCMACSTKQAFFWTISPKLKGIKLKIFLKLNENFPQNSKYRRIFPKFPIKLCSFCSVKVSLVKLPIQPKTQRKSSENSKSHVFIYKTQDFPKKNLKVFVRNSKFSKN